MKDEYDGVLDSTTGGVDFSTGCVCDTLDPPYCQACRQRTKQKEMLIAKYPEIFYSNEARMLVSYLLDMYIVKSDVLDRVLEEMSKRHKEYQFDELITEVMGSA